MITYGYAICYKDTAGFLQPVFDETTDGFLVFRIESKAKQALEKEKEKAYQMWRPSPTEVTEGMLWWKKTYNVSPKICPIKSDLGRQIYNTIQIRKVKMA